MTARGGGEGLAHLLATPRGAAPTSLQDPLVATLQPSLHGALIQAIKPRSGRDRVQRWKRNPVVLAMMDCAVDGNLHTASLSLACETLGWRSLTVRRGERLQTHRLDRNGYPNTCRRSAALAGFGRLPKKR